MRETDGGKTGAGLRTSPAWQMVFHALPALSGALAGAALPGGALPWVGVVAYVPLFAAWHLLGGGGPRRVGSWLAVAAGSLLHGVVQAWVAGGWVAEALIRFDAVPAAVAWALTVGGLGLLLGVETLLFLGVPYLLGRGRPVWGLLLLVAWVAAWQAVLPRPLPWSYGIYLQPWSWLIQPLDLIGPAGLSALALAPQWVAQAWVSRLALAMGAPASGLRPLVGASVAVVLALALAAGYGAERIAAIEAAEAHGAPVRLVAVQPNFSMEAPSDEPGAAQPDHPRSLSALVRQSDAALAGLPLPRTVPTVVLWPESAYPRPFFSLPRVAEVVRRWARKQDVHLVLQSASAPLPDPRTGRAESYHGLAIHLPPDDGEPTVYRKMALMPFGDAIPLADAWPALGGRVQRWWPRAGRYRAGEDFTVFQVAPKVQLAPMICFDAVNERIAAGMARAGANIGVVLANLTWFGPTRIGALMAHAVTFRAVESRMPIVLAGLTGPTLLVDATGRPLGKRVPAGQPGVLRRTLRLPAVSSFHARHGGMMTVGYGLLLAAVLGWRAWGALRGQRTRPNQAGGSGARSVEP